MKKFEFNNTEYIAHVLEQSHKLLDKCQIYKDRESRKGLETNVSNSIASKGWLRELFEKHPAYDGNGHIILPMEFDRDINMDTIYDFVNYIKSGSRKLLIEGTIDGMTYEQVGRELDDVARMCRGVDNYFRYAKDDEIVIKGVPFTQIRESKAKLEEIYEAFYNETSIECFCGKYWTKESNAKRRDVDRVMTCITNYPISTLNEEMAEKFSKGFPSLGIRVGAKTSRMVQKILNESGVAAILEEEDEHEYNKMYAKFCDAINPLKVTRWSVLSINFVDFLSMSHGNSWTSCLNTDKSNLFTHGEWSNGFNSRRTLDYALDDCTMVFYTVNSEYDGDEIELQPKITRQLFHFGNRKLIQGRLYPQSDNSRRNTYDQYRSNVEKILADCMEDANLWSAPKRGSIAPGNGVFDTPYDCRSYGDYIDFSTYAAHGCDERDFQSEVNYVIFKGSDNFNGDDIEMIIGSIEAVDIITGHFLDEDYTVSITEKWGDR